MASWGNEWEGIRDEGAVGRVPLQLHAFSQCAPPRCISSATARSVAEVWHERSCRLVKYNEKSRRVYGLLKFIVQVTWNGHFLHSVDSLPSGLLIKGNRCVFAPLFKGTLREERGKYSIIPNYRVVDDVVEEPSQPSPAAVVINSGSMVISKRLSTFVVQGSAHQLQTRQSQVIKSHVARNSRPTRFGGRAGSNRKGYLLTRQSHKKANSEYRRLTEVPRCTHKHGSGVS